MDCEIVPLRVSGRLHRDSRRECPAGIVMTAGESRVVARGTDRLRGNLLAQQGTPSYNTSSDSFLKWLNEACRRVNTSMHEQQRAASGPPDWRDRVSRLGRGLPSAMADLYGKIIAQLTSLLSIPVARTATIIVAVFVIDSLAPPGISAGALYIAAVLAAVAIRNQKATYITAGICSLLVLVGWFTSPGQGQVEWWKILINHMLDLGVIWVAAGMADAWSRMQRRRSKEVLESRLLHQATALSASQLSLRDALENSLKTLCDIVGWSAGHVYVRDSSGRNLVASGVWYTGDNAVFELLRAATRGLRFSQHEGAVGRAWKAAEPMAVWDVSTSPDYAWLKEPERLDIASTFLLPVTVGGKVVAVMEFFSARPIHIDAEFKPLACNVGEQLGRLFERRKAEQTIRQSEERLRLALQGGGMGTWEWHMESGQVTWSPELEQIHGLAPGTFEGTLEAMQREVHPEDRSRVTEAIERLLEEGGEYRIEYRVTRPDGSVQWLEGRGAVYADTDGQSRRLVGVCMNISERKQIEEQNARLAAIVQSSDDAILAKTLDGTILSWNGGAERIYGYRADEVIGKSVSVLSPEGRLDEISDIMERIALGQRVDHYETLRQRKDGQVIDISLTVSPIRNSEGIIIGASSVSSDITDRKRAEREMQEARAKAETAQPPAEPLPGEHESRIAHADEFHSRDAATDTPRGIIARNPRLVEYSQVVCRLAARVVERPLGLFQDGSGQVVHPSRAFPAQEHDR